MKIAMWSGPRNLSTAMMYAFGNRADFHVWDEPFYAPYLAATEAKHPMRSEILAAHETDPIVVAARISETKHSENRHLYMKHMPHHMIGAFPIEWAKDCMNIHLIRHPARVIASYGNKRDDVSDDDLGFMAQLQLWKQIGGPVVDSADIRDNPRKMLAKICDLLSLKFDDSMLSWPVGPKPFDGAWAPHWYDAVHKSTGFAGPEGPLPDVSNRAGILDRALPAYEEMAESRL